MIRQMAMKDGNGVLGKYKAREKLALREEDFKTLKTAKLTYFQYMVIIAFNNKDIAQRNNLLTNLWSWFATPDALGITCTLNDLPKCLQTKINHLV